MTNKLQKNLLQSLQLHGKVTVTVEYLYDAFPQAPEEDLTAALYHRLAGVRGADEMIMQALKKTKDLFEEWCIENNFTFKHTASGYMVEIKK